MSEDDATRVLQIVKELREWVDKAEQLRVHHLQTMLAIAAAQPDLTFRISRWDYQRMVGHSLAVHTDPDTGDTVYTAIHEGRHEDAPRDSTAH